MAFGYTHSKAELHSSVTQPSVVAVPAATQTSVAHASENAPTKNRADFCLLTRETSARSPSRSRASSTRPLLQERRSRSGISSRRGQRGAARAANVVGPQGDAGAGSGDRHRAKAERHRIGREPQILGIAREQSVLGEVAAQNDQPHVVVLHEVREGTVFGPLGQTVELEPRIERVTVPLLEDDHGPRQPESAKGLDRRADFGERPRRRGREPQSRLGTSTEGAARTDDQESAAQRNEAPGRERPRDFARRHRSGAEAPPRLGPLRPEPGGHERQTDPRGDLKVVTPRMDHEDLGESGRRDGKPYAEYEANRIIEGAGSVSQGEEARSRECREDD